MPSYDTVWQALFTWPYKLQQSNETAAHKLTMSEGASEAAKQTAATEAAAARDAAAAVWARERASLEAEAESLRIVFAADMNTAKAGPYTRGLVHFLILLESSTLEG